MIVSLNSSVHLPLNQHNVGGLQGWKLSDLAPERKTRARIFLLPSSIAARDPLLFRYTIGDCYLRRMVILIPRP
jgi:hypothetical protein